MADDGRHTATRAGRTDIVVGQDGVLDAGEFEFEGHRRVARNDVVFPGRERARDQSEQCRRVRWRDQNVGCARVDGSGLAGEAAGLAVHIRIVKRDSPGFSVGRGVNEVPIELGRVDDAKVDFPVFGVVRRAREAKPHDVRADKPVLRDNIHEGGDIPARGVGSSQTQDAVDGIVSKGRRHCRGASKREGHIQAGNRHGVLSQASADGAAAVAHRERGEFIDVCARRRAVPCVVARADTGRAARAKHPATGRARVEGEPHLLHLGADLHHREVGEVQAILVERGAVRQRWRISLDDGVSVIAADGDLFDFDGQWLGAGAVILGGIGEKSPWQESTLQSLRVRFDFKLPGIEGVDAC